MIRPDREFDRHEISLTILFGALIFIGNMLYAIIALWGKEIMKIFFPLMMCLLIGCTSIRPDGMVMRNATGNAVASLLIPGMGQFCNREKGKGTAYLGATALFYGLWVNSEKVYDDGVVRITYRDDNWLYALFAVNLISAFDAANSSHQYNLELMISPDRIGAGLAFRF